MGTAGITYPHELTPALAEVLGIPNFRMHAIWMALREVGATIEHRYEAEMAAALHFLIPLAIEYGDEWQRAAAEKLKAMKAEHLTRQGQDA